MLPVLSLPAQFRRRSEVFGVAASFRRRLASLLVFFGVTLAFFGAGQFATPIDANKRQMAPKLWRFLALNNTSQD